MDVAGQVPRPSLLSSPAPDDATRAARRAASIAAGWKYYHSETLGMEYAVKVTDSGVRMMTADGTEYLPSELEVLRKAGGEVPKTVHVIKHLFNGEIVGTRQVMPPT